MTPIPSPRGERGNALPRPSLAIQRKPTAGRNPGHAESPLRRPGSRWLWAVSLKRPCGPAGPHANARQPKSSRQRAGEAVVTLNLPKRDGGRPKRGRPGGRRTSNRPAFTPSSPAESAALRPRKTSTRNEVTPRPLSVRSITEQAAKPHPLGRPRRASGRDGLRSQGPG
jgi:hypothetical protein